MTCKTCGASVSSGSRVCPRCGTRQERPSGAEVRAHIRSRQQPAEVCQPSRQRRTPPAASPRKVRRSAPSASLVPNSGAVPLLCLAGSFLWLLQILFFFIKSVFVGAGSYGLRVSLCVFLRGSEAPLLGTLLLFLCILGLISMLLPFFLQNGRERIRLALVPPALLLPLYIIALIAVGRGAVYVKPSFGPVVWLFLLNCLLLTGLSFLLAEQSGPLFFPALSSAAPASASPAAAPGQARRPPVKTAPSAPNAETIASLRKIAQMHTQGLITDEEFARVKAECAARGWIRQS